MKHKNFAINLSLLEILHPVGMLRLPLPRHKHHLFNAGDAPILVTNPTSRHCLSLALCVTQNPAIDHRAAILVSLRMRLLRSNLKLEKEHRHLNVREVGLTSRAQARGTK
ncbi:MAG: hypothetical protein ABSH15_02985 [Verrucomicrobiota bacterium]